MLFEDEWDDEFRVSWKSGINLQDVDFQNHRTA